MKQCDSQLKKATSRRQSNGTSVEFGVEYIKRAHTHVLTCTIDPPYTDSSRADTQRLCGYHKARDKA